MYQRTSYFFSFLSILVFVHSLAKNPTRVPVELARDGIHREQIFSSVSLCSWCTSCPPACTALETEILEQSQNTRSFTVSSVLPLPYGGLPAGHVRNLTKAVRRRSAKVMCSKYVSQKRPIVLYITQFYVVIFKLAILD